jgi:hypothetical protein
VLLIRVASASADQPATPSSQIAGNDSLAGSTEAS